MARVVYNRCGERDSENISDSIWSRIIWWSLCLKCYHKSRFYERQQSWGFCTSTDWRHLPIVLLSRLLAGLWTSSRGGLSFWKTDFLYFTTEWLTVRLTEVGEHHENRHDWEHWDETFRFTWVTFISLDSRYGHPICAGMLALYFITFLIMGDFCF